MSAAHAELIETPLHRPRLSGARVTVAFVILLAVALVLAIVRWKATRWPEGDVVAVCHAIGDDVVYAIRADEGNYWGYLVLADRLEGPRWDAALYGLQDAAYPVSLAPGLVLVRGLDPDGHLETYAFDLDGGKFRWRGGRASPGARPIDTQATFAIGDRILELYSNEAIVLDLAGHEQTRVALLSTPRSATLEGDHVVVTGERDTIVLDRDANITREAPRATLTEGPSWTLHIGELALDLGPGPVIAPSPLLGPRDGWLPLLVQHDRAFELVLVSIGETALATERYLLTHANADSSLAVLRVADKPASFVVRVDDDLYSLAADATIRHGVRVRGGVTHVALADAVKGGSRLWIGGAEGTRLLSLPELRAIRSFSSAPAIHGIGRELPQLVRPLE